MKCPECGGAGECEYEVEVPAPMAWNGGWPRGTHHGMPTM